MARLTLEAVIEPQTATTLKGRFPSASLDARQAVRELIALLSAMGGGMLRGRLRIGIDDSVGVKASGTIACTQASITSGDVLEVAGVILTAVAGTADATAGEFSKDTSSTAVGTSLAAAINGYPPLKRLVTATAASGTVTITAVEAGTVGNGIRLLKVVTTAGAFTLSGATLSGGRDAGSRQSLTASFSGVGTANDTLTIGAVVLTLKAAAINENEVTIGASATATAAAVAAAINAHTKLKGLVSATSATSVVTITLANGGRIGSLVAVTKSSSAITLSAASFAPTTTETYGAGPQQYDLGIPS